MSKKSTIENSQEEQKALPQSREGLSASPVLITRRQFIHRSFLYATTLILPEGSGMHGQHMEGQKAGDILIRPPSALPEQEFLRTCINCHLCSRACPNDCIRYVYAPFNSLLHDTPYIAPRKKACILCMKCTRACPSGALRPLASDDGDLVRQHVKMGTAVVDKNICNSYQNRSCGVCVQACPYSGVAIEAQTWERPVVNKDNCVGCGLCEQSCIHFPQAIRVIPAQRRA